MDDSVMDWRRLERFIRREGTPAELEELDRWVAADPRRRALADAMRSVGRASDPANLQQRFDANRALRHVQRRVGTARAEPRPRPATRLRGKGRFEIAISALAAAALVVAITLSGSRRAVVSNDPPPEPAREIVTAPGQRATLTLGDGTRLVLSPESHLRVPAGFGGGAARRRREAREVWLEGEASFIVRHDSMQRFVVHTPNGSVEDLGTEFAISTYPEVRGLRVAVREGRVAVLASADTGARAVATLDKGDVARVGGTGRVNIARNQAVESYFAASDGSLLLESTRLRDAIPRLERWYGIRIRVKDGALLDRTVSGVFRAESATAALGIIGVLLNSETEWYQNEVTLRPKPVPGEEQ